ncbi:MAG: LysM peptidoglycan-binding domain-containing protein [Eubacterium sp.]|nr:LysM peptidoglycan-binding domain-containing protein [Eubacterium sp.]
MNRRFCNGMVHVIKEGENLYQLSRAYRVPLALILRANPYVDVYNLQVGQEICIPVAKPFGGMMRPPMGRPRRPQEAAPQNGMMAPEETVRDREEQMEEERERLEEERERMEEERERLEEERERREEAEREREEERREARERLAQTEEVEEKAVCVSDGTKSFGAILRENGITMEEFFAANDPEQVIIAADVTYELPKKV